jgi:hypothetical protein
MGDVDRGGRQVTAAAIASGHLFGADLAFLAAVILFAAADLLHAVAGTDGGSRYIAPSDPEQVA